MRARGPRKSPELVPKQPNSTGQNLLRMGVFTLVGVGGTFAAFTGLDAMHIRDRLSLRPDFRKPGLLDRVREALPSLTSSGVLYGIGATCSVVFLGWRIPAMRAFMSQYFMCSPKSSAPVRGLILSTYSHQDPLHFGINMICFLSFFEFLKGELSPRHLLFFCWSAGLVSGYGSALVKVAARSGAASLGFSGVLMASIAYICVKAPDTRFSIFFLGSFRGDQILPCIILFDLCGLLFFRRVTFFDHGAHLIGAGFGMFHAYLGEHLYANRVRSLVGRDR